MIDFTVSAQRRRDLLALFPGIAEDETLLSSRVLEDIADPRIRGKRRLVGGGGVMFLSGDEIDFGRPGVLFSHAAGQAHSLKLITILCIRPVCGTCRPGRRLQERPRLRRHSARPHAFLRILHNIGSLRRRMIKMLHRQSPPHALCLNIGNHRSASAALRKESPGFLRISDRRGQADPARIDSCHPAEPLDQAHALPAPVAPQQRMNLIDHNISKIAEQFRHLGMLVHQQRLQ